MKWGRIERLVAAGLLLGGCVPMQQASLVYVSKNQVGVGVSAGVPESPGLDVNIGFKSLDAAYVPVAVARACAAGEAQCDQKPYELLQVAGKNSVSDSRSADQKRIAEYKDSIRHDRAEQDELRGKLKVAEDKIAAIDTLANETAELARLQNPTALPDGTIPLDQAKINATKQRIADIRGYQIGRAQIDAEIPALKKAIAALDIEINRNYNLLGEIVSNPDSASGDDKFDAYSVFGTFEAAPQGTAEGASLSLGKVFATGIAAQNMSQGARAESASRCLAAADKLLANPKFASAAPQDLAERLFLLCGRAGQ
jgi:hypothetical protein